MLLKSLCLNRLKFDLQKELCLPHMCSLWGCCLQVGPLGPGISQANTFLSSFLLSSLLPSLPSSLGRGKAGLWSSLCHRLKWWFLPFSRQSSRPLHWPPMETGLSFRARLPSFLHCVFCLLVFLCFMHGDEWWVLSLGDPYWDQYCLIPSSVT